MSLLCAAAVRTQQGMPLAARAYPVECRSMWTCTGKGGSAVSPARSIILPIPMRLFNAFTALARVL
jgi:hypothetical protein